MSTSFPLPKAYFVALFCEAILHGMLSNLCAICYVSGLLQVYTRYYSSELCIFSCECFDLLDALAAHLSFSGPRRRQTKRTSAINMIMVVLTVLMYGLSTTHVGLSLQQNLIAFFDQHAADGGDTILNDPNDPLVYSQIAIEVVNVSRPPVCFPGTVEY